MESAASVQVEGAAATARILSRGFRRSNAALASEVDGREEEDAASLGAMVVVVDGFDDNKFVIVKQLRPSMTPDEVGRRLLSKSPRHEDDDDDGDDRNEMPRDDEGLPLQFLRPPLIPNNEKGAVVVVVIVVIVVTIVLPSPPLVIAPSSAGAASAGPSLRARMTTSEDDRRDDPTMEPARCRMR